MSISLFRSREGFQIEGQRDPSTDNSNRVNIIKARIDPTVTGVDAPRGSLLLRTDTGAAYIKTSDTGTPTGWTLMLTSSGASSEDTYQNSFMGKSGAGVAMPTYSSTNVVATSDSLQTAIGKIDTKIGANPTSVGRTNNPIVNASALQVNIDNLDAAIGADTTPVTRTNNPIIVNATVNSNIDTLDAAIGANVTSTNYASTTNTVNQNISAIDTQVKTNTDAIVGLTNGVSWRTKVKVITADTELRAATEGTSLASVLPFSDDQGTQLVIGDFSIGDYLISENGSSSKLWRVATGNLLTLVGFNALASGDTFFITYDLLDTVDAQETNAIYTFNGTAMVKMSDVDWQLATGIDISSSYSASSGNVVSGDSVEAAIQKIEGASNALVTLSGVTKGSVNLGAFATGSIISDNTTIKNAFNELDTSTSNIITLSGVAKDSVNLGSFATGTVIADNVTIKTALQTLDAEVTNVRTTIGTAVGSLHMGSYTGGLLSADQTTKQNIQQLETELVSRETKFSVSAAGSGASTTVDSFILSTLNSVGAEWVVSVLNGTTGRYMTKILSLANSAGTSIDNNEYGSLEVGTSPNISFSVTISTGTVSLSITNNEAGSVTVIGTRSVLRQ